MQPENPISLTNRKDYGKHAHRLSRREFLKIALVASGGLGLWLSGCSPGTEQTVENKEPLASDQRDGCAYRVEVGGIEASEKLAVVISAAEIISPLT